jgi:hypothetical protein
MPKRGSGLPPWGGGGPWKRSLPPPYNKNLAGVLRHLNRRTRWGKRQLANDPVTASYLCAGMSLLEQHLVDGRCQCRHPHDPSNLLSFLSQRNVVEAMAQNPKPFSRQGSTWELRDRWKYHQKHYVPDLVNFALWIENYLPSYGNARAQIIAKLTSAPDIAQAVHEVAYWHTAEAANAIPARLSLALLAAGEQDPDITAAIARAYRSYLGMWQALYKQVMATRRVRLRPGLDINDLATALSAATDGIVLHAIGGLGANVLDHQHRKSLMGDVTLAIIYAFLEPEDDADGQTLDQAVARRFSRGPR